ncbi:MAG: winged helix-turn-helix domain-containing protein [Xanthomonadales bacterium]|nr:winged helix-turn-helix domain-containing protein [Xanthomonadales bacterium]
MSEKTGSTCCRVDLDSGDVWREGAIERLSPRLLKLLHYLVQCQGQVISRDALMTAVWGHLEAASDDSVNVAVSALRRHLGDNARAPQVIQTIPRRGYRYTGIGVELVDPGALQPLAEPVPAPVAVEMPRTEVQADSREPGSAGVYRWTTWSGLGLMVVALALWITMPDETNQPAASSATAVTVDESPAVAVLPFLDLSPAADQGYLADALVDRIIHVLAQAQGLQVAARTSSFAYRDRTLKIEQIGRELGVSAVLEGSVLHHDGQMRVLAQLIDVESGKHLWSRSYDRNSDALFEVQDEIANEVARTLTDTLLPSLALTRPVSRAAYDLASRAQHRFDEATVASVNEALSLYRQALQHDPDYVDALVGIYEATGLALALGSPLAADAREAGLAALQQAVAQAPDDPSVLRARAADLRRQGNNEQALSLYRLALRSRPNDSVAWGQLGDLLLHLNRYEDGLEALRRAERIDPLSLRITARLADAYWSVGRAEEALVKLRAQLQRVDGKGDGAPMLHDRMATYLNQLGRTGEAMRHIEAARRLDPESGLRWFRVCEFHLQLGDPDAAERCTDEFVANHELPFRATYLRQAIHAFRGEWEAQLALMDELLALTHPADPLTPALVAMARARVDCPTALTLLRERYAGLFEQPPRLAPVHSYAARTAIHCLQSEDHAAAESLLQAFVALVERLRLQQGPWAIGGDEAAAAHGLAGDDAAALAELQRLVDAGWRYYWWGLDVRPEYAGIRDRPEFAQLQRKLREGVRREHAYWLANRELPLTAP